MAQRLGLGDQLLLGQGEENSGGRGRVSNLAGGFEALLGAAFLDQGYQAAKVLILGLFEPALEWLAQGGVPKDAKSRLQERVQRQGSPSPVYRIVSETGPDHAKHFVAEAHLEGQVLGRGTGRRKGEAEASAAQDALAHLDAQDGDEGKPPDARWWDGVAT
jgi:ribonuclease-3